MHEQENHVDRDQVPQQPMIGLKKVTRKDKMALRLQQAYRCRMGRRILRRFQKLKVFRLETIAGITLQCFFRLKLAQKAGMHRDSKESCVCVRVCVSCYTHVPRAWSKKNERYTYTQRSIRRAPCKCTGAFVLQTHKKNTSTHTHTRWHTRIHTPALLSATRKRALAHYKRFMLTSKPDLKMHWSDDEMETLAAIMMQAAWRRRQVLPVVCVYARVYACMCLHVSVCVCECVCVRKNEYICMQM